MCPCVSNAATCASNEHARKTFTRQQARTWKFTVYTIRSSPHFAHLSTAWNVWLESLRHTRSIRLTHGTNPVQNMLNGKTGNERLWYWNRITHRVHQCCDFRVVRKHLFNCKDLDFFTSHVQIIFLAVCSSLKSKKAVAYTCLYTLLK